MSSPYLSTVSPAPLSQTPMSSVEALEAECNELGMEILNVLEYISGSIDYQKITQLVQKLSRSMDSIVKGVEGLKHISEEDLEAQLAERKQVSAVLQQKLESYQERIKSG